MRSARNPADVFLLLPADFTRKSIAHARKSKRKGSIGMKDIREISGSRGVNGTETEAGI